MNRHFSHTLPSHVRQIIEKRDRKLNKTEMAWLELVCYSTIWLRNKQKRARNTFTYDRMFVKKSNLRSGEKNKAFPLLFLGASPPPCTMRKR